MIKKAVILAAGEGKRLKPYTETMPKVMIPVANKPIVEYVIDSVFKSGIEEIILIVGYRKETVMEYLREKENITYVTQDKQLGTAHALLYARDYIDEPFIILAGDNIIDDKSVSRLIHSESKFSLMIKEHPLPSKYGVVFLKDNKVERIVEKPLEIESKFISTGIYKFPPMIFDEIEKLTSHGIYDLTSVLQKLISQGIEVDTIVAERWMDIVYPWDILYVNGEMIHDISSSISGSIEKNVTLKGNVSIGRDSRVYAGSYIQGPVVIGEGCEIGPNVCIYPSTVIGDNVVVNSFSEIRNSVIMDEVHIGSNASISNSVIGKGSIINSHFSIISGKAKMEVEGEFKELENIGAIIGEDCDISSHVAIEPGRIIGRRCSIDSFKRVIKDIPSEMKVM
ncbi:MAG: nucleotidyl transferase [Thermoplasmata archaeon]|nr:MAG: nucleotidyl transferase [Thermoplasmata archaeon]